MKYFMYYCPDCKWSHHKFDRVMVPQCPGCGVQWKMWFAQSNDRQEMVDLCRKLGIDEKLIGDEDEN